jgi:LytS/YehU family sensor histidine kinase
MTLLRPAANAPAWGWMLLTIFVCAVIGVVPQAHAFEVLGVPDAPTAALRWQGVLACWWALAAVPLSRRWSLADREGRALLGLLGLVLLISLASAWAALTMYTFSPQWSQRTIVTELHFGALPTHALTATMLSLVGSWTNARRQRARALDREATLQAHATQAELDALRERTQPHFVLNALNTVAALARRGDTDAASEVAADLGELLRFSLVSEPFVAFDTEREIINRTLAIEQARFGDALQVRWEIEPAAHTTTLPSLSWQPLVENAVRHDLARVEGGGHLVLGARVTATHLELSVRTIRSVDVRSAVTHRDGSFGGLGMGRATLERRLALLYGTEASVTFASSDDGTLTTLRLPRAHPAGRGGVIPSWEQRREDAS